MKVAFLLPQIVMGGVEKILLELLSEFQKQYPECQITVYSNTRVKDTYFIDFFKNHRIPLKDGWFLTKPTKLLAKIFYKLINPIFKLLRRPLLRYNLLRGKYDILIDFMFFNFAKEINRINIPKITWIHSSINHFNLHSKRILPYIRYYDKIVCLSHSFEEDFKDQYPEYADKMTCIYNFVNINTIRSKAKLDLTQGRYFCSVSRLDIEKDIETIISAFKIFIQKYPDAKLLIAGSGILENKLHRMAADCPQIRFLGQVNEPYTLIKNSVAHILSSYNEGFPMVLIETAALGTLSVSSKCKSGPAEILMNGKAGILFEPGNKYQLAEIMENIWTNKTDTEKLIQTATDNINRFSATQNVKSIMNLINQVIKNNSKENYYKT